MRYIMVCKHACMHMVHPTSSMAVASARARVMQCGMRVLHAPPHPDRTRLPHASPHTHMPPHTLTGPDSHMPPHTLTGPDSHMPPTLTHAPPHPDRTRHHQMRLMAGEAQVSDICPRVYALPHAPPQ